MQVQKFSISGPVLLIPRVFQDERGYLFESYNQKILEEILQQQIEFVQENESFSHAGVLRGLHFQMSPHAQGKLIRVLQGAILDVVVDIRADSPSFGQHVVTMLNDQDKRLFWIPEGFAHGFLAIQDSTLVSYKCTRLYHPPSCREILWNDSDLGIEWGIEKPILSIKDQHAASWKEIQPLLHPG